MTQRIVDLTHIIKPTGPDAVRRFDVGHAPAIAEPAGKVRPQGEWYIMSHVDVMVHVGTHIEMPYHCLKAGADLASVPVEQLVGDGVVLRLRHGDKKADVTLARLQAAARVAGGIRAGDIVLCDVGDDDDFATDALEWLVAQGMKLMAVSSGGVELEGPEHRNTNHLVLFRAGIPLIENLAHMDRLTQTRVQVYALPIPAQDVDAFPLRVIAIEQV
jgi:arylformamidase